MNIVICTDSYFPRINGVTVSVQSFSQKMVEYGHNVLIACPSFPKKQQAAGNYIENINDPEQKASIYREKSYVYIFSKSDRLVYYSEYKGFEKRLNEFKPDLIHVNSEFNAGYLGLKYCKKHNVPLVMTMHTYWEKYISNYFPIPCKNFVIPRFVGLMENPYLKQAAHLIVPTENMKKVSEKFKYNCPVSILPTGIPDMNRNFDYKKADETREKLYDSFPAMKNKKILLFAGRIANEKNLGFLVPVMEKVMAQKPDAVLLLVGGGDYENELKSRVKKSRIADKVFFTGFVQSSEIMYYYDMADIFVFPSLTETQGLVTLEAMNCGLPVVAIGEMGTADVMQGNHGGFMVNADINEFADRIIQLLSDKALYEAKSKEAVEWEKQWSLDYLAPKLEEIYKSVLKTKN